MKVSIYLPYMTRLGQYLTKKSVNKSEVARKTGLSNPRLSELTINPKAKLRGDELYLIALAIEADPCELLRFLYGELQLNGKENHEVNGHVTENIKAKA